MAATYQRPGGGWSPRARHQEVETPVRRDSRLYASYAVGGIARFTIIAVLWVVLVWVVGFMSVPAYLIWSAGWDAGLWLVLGWVA